MKTARSPLTLLATALLLGWGCVAARGADAVTTVTLHVTTAPNPSTGVDIGIRLHTPAGKEIFGAFIDAAQSQNASLFDLALTESPDEQVELKIDPPKPGEPETSGITLHPVKPLDPNKSYQLRVLPGGIVFDTEALRRRNIQVLPFENQWFPIDKNRLKEDSDFVTPYPETKASLIQGDTGAFSLSANYRRYFGRERYGALHANLDADLGFRSPSRKDYIDAVQAELGGYWVMKPPASILELGISTKTQADQEFRKIDQTIGLNGWFWLNCWLFDRVYRFPTSLLQPGHKDAYGAPPPTIVLGYDYAAHLRDDGATRPDGADRLTGRFYWVIPILQRLNSPLPLLSEVKGVNFVADVSAIYDINKGKFAPETKLSLDFPLSTTDKEPSITISFVNGQAPPRFENFDAVLAGFKMKL